MSGDQTAGTGMDWLWHYPDLGIVGVVSSAFTSFVARRRFVSERWWERKADAYTSILEALVHMHRYHEAYYEDLTHEAELSEERKAELTATWKTAWREVDSAIRLGGFLISEEAHAALTQLRTATRGVHPDDFFGLVDAEYAATGLCIEEIREMGRTDLQVSRRGWVRSRLGWFGKRARRVKVIDSVTP